MTSIIMMLITFIITYVAIQTFKLSNKIAKLESRNEVQCDDEHEGVLTDRDRMVNATQTDIMNKCTDLGLFTNSQEELIRILKNYCKEAWATPLSDTAKAIAFLYEKGVVKINPTILARAIAMISVYNHYKSLDVTFFGIQCYPYDINEYEARNAERELRYEVLESLLKDDFAEAICDTIVEEEKKKTKKTKAKKKIAKNKEKTTSK